MQTLLLFGDGGSRGNPGKAASGFVIYEEAEDKKLKTNNEESLFESEKEITSEFEKTPRHASPATPLVEGNGKVLIYEGGKYLGITTNNQAEWQSLTLGMEKIISDFNSKEVYLKVFLDSELVIKQAKGIYKVKNLDLKVHFDKLKLLEKQFKKVDYTHVYRENNKEADKMVNKILDES